MNLADVISHEAHIAFYEWRALGGEKPCVCFHCRKYRINQISNEVVITP